MYNKPDQTGNDSGNPEHVYMQSEPPVDYDRRHDHNSHF